MQLETLLADSKTDSEQRTHALNVRRCMQTTKRCSLYIDGLHTCREYVLIDIYCSIQCHRNSTIVKQFHDLLSPSCSIKSRCVQLIIYVFNVHYISGCHTGEYADTHAVRHT